jgi:hypothetical protein
MIRSQYFGTLIVNTDEWHKLVVILQ